MILMVEHSSARCQDSPWIENERDQLRGLFHGVRRGRVVRTSNPWGVAVNLGAVDFPHPRSDGRLEIFHFQKTFRKCVENNFSVDIMARLGDHVGCGGDSCRGLLSVPDTANFRDEIRSKPFLPQICASLQSYLSHICGRKDYVGRLPSYLGLSRALKPESEGMSVRSSLFF